MTRHEDLERSLVDAAMRFEAAEALGDVRGAGLAITALLDAAKELRVARLVAANNPALSEEWRAQAEALARELPAEHAARLRALVMRARGEL